MCLNLESTHKFVNKRILLQLKVPYISLMDEKLFTDYHR